jgi:hypothetical protein
MTQMIALFGEAEKGEFRTAYFFQNVAQLLDNLGNPPQESKGLFYAVQTLMMEKDLIFFRVEEEGFSTQDYLLGLRFLEQKHLIPQLSAVFMPGVGDSEIMRAITPVCELHRSLVITNEADLYDYLTA